uniref:Myb-like domain-containing protein n=1 Tax=Musa acuminata subsp. malaccensis TaxID=214687 RepID=A0A804KN57_MUSAM
MVKEEESCCSVWTREQEKAFENALATHPEDCGDRWEKIAAGVPGKSIEDIRHHYELLVEDIDDIESGRVPVPSYLPVEGGGAKKGGNSHGDPSHGGRTSRSDQERRKGIAWTEDEHRRLEEHISQLCNIKDAHTSCKSCTEILYPFEFNEQGTEKDEHPRYHQRRRWRCISPSRPSHWFG